MPVIILMLGTGIYFTVATGFFQLRGIRTILRKTVGKCFGEKKEGSSQLSPVQAFFTSLAATVGTGSVTGVAAALATGGAGAVFWMWVSALFGMMTAFAENVLGGLFRKELPDGTKCGGAMYYMEKGLGSKALGRVFAFCCVLASLGMGNMAQSNSISTALSQYKIPPAAVGAVIAAAIGFVIFGSKKRAGGVSEKLVPFMAGFYIIGCVIAAVMNYRAIIPCFKQIFSEAFNLRSAVGGGLGTVISTGFRRGIFSNEAGLGTTVAVHGSSTVTDPCEQGMWGIFEVFIDTIVICTLTAVVILTSGASYSSGGSDVVVRAFESGFNGFGGIFVAASIVLFAFATLIGWSFIGTQAWEYLFPKGRNFYKAAFTACVFVGAVSGLDIVWGISDTFNGLMIIPNLAAVMLLRKTVLSEFRSKNEK